MTTTAKQSGLRDASQHKLTPEFINVSLSPRTHPPPHLSRPYVEMWNSLSTLFTGPNSSGCSITLRKHYGRLREREREKKKKSKTIDQTHGQKEEGVTFILIGFYQFQEGLDIFFRGGSGRGGRDKTRNYRAANDEWDSKMAYHHLHGLSSNHHLKRREEIYFTFFWLKNMN